MANLHNVLNDHVRRLAKRETTASTRASRRLTAKHRRDIAALKRQVVTLRTSVAFLERQERRRVAGRPAPQTEGLRFRVDGLKSHRCRLGISAEDYGRLVGASGLSIYNWESGKVRPRKEQITKLAAVRGIGKREAARRLESYK